MNLKKIFRRYFNMMVRIDKYFILELQKQEYDLDYKKLTSIYRVSREREDFKRSKKHNNFVNNFVNEQMAKELLK